MVRAILPMLLCLASMTADAHAQGCTQCRDNTAAMPAKTQAAYRHAIILMVCVAGTIFAGAVFIVRKTP